MPKKTRPARRPWTPAALEKLATMHARGVPGATIAARLGRTRAAIYQRVSAEGLSRRRTKKKTGRRKGGR